MAQAYLEYDPPQALKPFIRKIWTYVADMDGEVQKIVPDGCAELIVHRGAPYEELTSQGWQVQPAVLFAGQLTRPLHLRATGHTDVLAVRFEPDGARDFTDRSMADMTDRRVAMADLPMDEEDLLEFLVERAGGWTIDVRVRDAIAGLADGAPVAGDRTLQRRFLDRVGVSRKALGSVLRFRSVFDRALHGDNDAIAWLDAGLDAGYFDQPQLARDFQRYLGCSATQWARGQLALARNIAAA
ncbi:fis family transcriptional regulator [Asticcacaulis biprosthecium C19]|uniref:Fis family transcriptional regulator n=1 Tax=Asticcacaulis biprosthecium C19 TaxID=715226 RepID=F4QL77_9CAUL|nr:helix-turn-helix domain-containing protein [Asticcacaulis biprosthecium]EGF93452.1 fis family transcriptional regulator [Asticcacaulis biprosthecium C19]